MLPYADIIEKADRRYTMRLLDRLAAADLRGGERGNLVRALQAVSDPRSFGPLEAVVTDPTRFAPLRRAAGAVLRGLHHAVLDVPGEKLRRWWLEGDAVLRRHALRSMGGVCCPDIVLAVASDPAHPLKAAALAQMEWWFDLPRYQAVKMAGLTHSDPKVRAAAAYVLLWDEPVAAEVPLLEATHDPEPAVAAEAANTLEYYPTQRVLRRLHELLDHANDKVREDAEDSYESIRNNLLICLCHRSRRVAEHLRRWLAPVWEMLEFTEEELRPDEDEGTTARREEHREALPVADLLKLLADADGSPLLLRDRLWANDWPRYDEGERRRLRPVLLVHPDQLVREQGAQTFAAWGDVGGLLDLAEDAEFSVRKAAWYWLKELPPTPGVAERAWNHLHRPDALGVHATETLDTFVKHADQAVAVQRLGWVAGDHGYRENLRVAAVDHLGKLKAARVVEQLAGLLREPPSVTWGLHLALLEAITELGRPMPDIRHLREVDSLHVQEALADCEAS
jgi:hypothetical protein